jgi:O-antigen/teichoic acid export membrane protein
MNPGVATRLARRRPPRGRTEGALSDPWLPTAHGSEKGSVRRRAARGLTWTVVDTWGRQLLNFLIFIVLARLLTPADFGLVALATVFVAFAQLVVDQGLGDALIQRREVDREHIDTAFWVAVATGTLLTGVGVVIAIPLAAVLGEPDLAPILQVLSLTFLLSALSSIQIAILRRELAFRSLAVRSLVAACGGGVIGIGMAVLGYGAWSLVGQQIGSAAFSVVTLWGVSAWRPGQRVSRTHFRQLLGFGVNVVGSDILNFLSRNVDNLLIGVFLGTLPLGLYSVAYRILTMTQVMLVNVARKIAFPAFARLQHDSERLSKAYLGVTRVGSVGILPGYIGLALIAPELTLTVFGHRWADAGPVASILFLIGPVLTLQAFSGALLNAAGHPNIVLRFRLITTVTSIIGFAIAVRFGILAVAAAFVIRGYLLLPLNLYWVRRYAAIPVRDYLTQMRGVALATVLMAAVMLGLRLVIPEDLGRLLFLLSEVAAGGLTFVAVVLLVERSLFHQVLRVGRLVLPAGGRSPGGGGGEVVPSGSEDG